MHTPKYGLTKSVETHNIVKLQYHEYSQHDRPRPQG